MRAWRVHELEGISALRLDEVPPAPAPGPGEATVTMEAVGLNYPDLLMLSGGYQFRPGLPFTPGMEGVGRISAVGEGLAGDLLGQRVLASARTGLLAEAVTLPLAALRAAPETLSDAEAAGFTTGFLTAWMALVHRGRLAAGDALLVLGAGGGMGLAAVALGAALGARVSALVSSEDKARAARAAGAAEVVERARSARELAVPGQFDLVFDPVGGARVAPAVACLCRGGRYLVIGFVGGPPVRLPLDLVQAREVEIIGVRAGESSRRSPALGRRALNAIDRLAAEGRVRPHVGMVVGMDEAPCAFAAMAAGRLVGKAVIRVCA